ncbi:hypothetical protein [Gordonia malaquae]|uniref:hypothetical protein n=1 Tax=Gordonia malaquae TaxID=410332 RepID=UPI0030FF041A
MTSFTTNEPAKRGDVAHVDRADGSPGDLAGIRVTLHGHAHQYVVAVALGKGGPRLVDLRVSSESGVSIKQDTLRAVPTRRLAVAAAQYARTHDGKLGTPALDVATQTALAHMDDQDEAAVEYRRLASAAKRRPEERTARGQWPESHYHAVAEAVRAAVRDGVPVRRTVAAKFGVTPQAVDKWIRRCKDDGLLDADEMRRPSERRDQ